MIASATCVLYTSPFLFLTAGLGLVSQRNKLRWYLLVTTDWDNLINVPQQMATLGLETQLTRGTATTWELWSRAVPAALQPCAFCFHLLHKAAATPWRPLPRSTASLENEPRESTEQPHVLAGRHKHLPGKSPQVFSCLDSYKPNPWVNASTQTKHLLPACSPILLSRKKC